jgi:hypothetical protein
MNIRFTSVQTIGVDNFNRANGTLGPNWAPGPGSNASILNNAMQNSAPGTGGVVDWVPARPSVKHGRAECVWSVYVGVEWGGPMALSHVNGINRDSYVLKAEDLGGGEPRALVTIVRRFAGANSNIAVSANLNLAAFVFGGVLGLEWNVTAAGTVLKATVNGTLVCQGTDNDGNQFTTGKPGIGVATFSGAVNQWDNFRYIPLVGGGNVDVRKRSLVTF